MERPAHPSFVPLLPLLPLLLGIVMALGCAPGIERMYYGQEYRGLASEEIPAVSAPLAREVRWTYAVTGPPGTTVYDDGRPRMPRVPADPVVLEASRARQAELDPVMDALGERVQSRELTPQPNVEAVIQIQANQLIRVALVEPGFVGPDAPPGSVLLLELHSVDAKAERRRGYDGVIAARVVLVREDGVRAAWRGFEGRGYARAPKSPPAGWIDASTQQRPPGTDGVSLWIHAAMVRSAAAELAR